eukprot:964925_1
MWKQLLDFLYDASICAFSVIDIFCDVYVTIQFYRKGHLIFFWISIFILFLAQISYTLLACFSLEPVPDPHATGSWQERQWKRQKKYIQLFIIILPFGQLVPLYLMIANAFPDTFDKFYAYMGYRNLLHQMKQNLFQVQQTTKSKHRIKRRAARTQTQEDPLSLYIRHKMMSHLGFCIESLIEAVPQSILQMVFLIMYSSNSESVSLINFISIIMSMIVVTSKGTILSYSIYRSAAIFNFLCFAIDIFGIFCVVSWLFCADPSMHEQEDTLFEYTLYGYKMWSASYYYFMILQSIFKCLALAATCAVCAAVSYSYESYGNHPWRQWGEIVMVSGIVTLVFFPIALLCLMVRFTLLPLLVLRAFDHSQNKSFLYYNTIFSFLTESSSIGEMHEKLLLSHWIFADIICKDNDRINYGYVKTQCSAIQEQYTKTQSVSLSFIYLQLGCPMLSKYHQLIEIVSLLCARKGLWGFLFVKIIFMLRLNSQNNSYLKCMVQWLYYILWIMCVPLDMNDISFLWNNDGVLNEQQQLKFDALEAVFDDTIIEIQTIINWDDFAQEVRDFVRSFLDIDVMTQWRWFKADVARMWNAFRNKYSNQFIRSQVTYGIRSFCVEGVYKCIVQDVINIYRTLHNRKNVHLSKWNIPRCWSSLDIMFGAKGRDDCAYANRGNAFWNEYEYASNSAPWIGRGIWVFMMVICYKCVHTPIQWVLGRLGGPMIMVFAVPLWLCGACVVVLVLLLAFYSVFLPIIFLFQHVYHFGFHMQQNTLQIVLTVFYLVILSAMIGLFSRVWKFVYCDIHLFRFFGDTRRTPQKYADFAIETYHAAPVRNQMIIDRFGPDIGGLMLMFLPKWHILNAQ